MTKHRGFTLVELVSVIVLLAILATVAVSRFVELGSIARVASLKSFQGTLITAAETVHAACPLYPPCDQANQGQYVSINGQLAVLNYGYPDAGDQLGTFQIDVFVNYEGFTASLVGDAVHTRFSADGAPDPAHCAVVYGDAYFTGGAPYTISIDSTGC